MKKYLNQLNDAQLEPTIQKEGPMMVIAGAGSGKTRVLTYRIAYLMSQNIDPFNILALTFTNKAAREMKSRIGRIVGESEAKNLWMGTFHSIFAKILRFESDKLGYPSNFTIYDTQDSHRLIASIIKEMGLDKDIYKNKQIFSRISSYKNNLITVKAYFNNQELIDSDVMAKRPKLGEIYKNYVDRCFKSGAMDFDDLLLKTNELLTRFPEVLAKYQQRFRYILVDEYQDTNHSQYLIVRALADRFQNICVVGDDSQSIYAFRGANINNILNFQRDYEDSKIYRLEQNYRSTKNIVNAANSVIDNNKNKLEKIVWTANEEGHPVIVNRSLTDGDEGRYVAASIFENKMNKRLQNKDFAVLYRTNAQSRAIEDALRKRGIDYKIYGGLSFYQRKEIKDVLCYLRLVINPDDEEAIKRVINFPARGIGQTTMNKLIVRSNEQNISIFHLIKNINTNEIALNNGTKAKLTEFATLIQSFQLINKSKNAFEITDYICRASGIIKELKKDSTPEGVSKIENIEELLSGIKDFVEGQKEIAESNGALEEFLEDVALATDLDNEKSENKEKVALMTIHIAKGLEFPFVYIVGMEEDLFPSPLSINTRNELEEERRLFYVAITRAQKQVYLSYSISRYRWGKHIDCEPSRFINEIDDQYLKFNESYKKYSNNPLLTSDIFSDVSSESIRLRVPKNFKKEKNLNKITGSENKKRRNKSNLFDHKLTVGNIVNHHRFGKGEVIKVDGVGVDKKAEIKFQSVGVKRLLLRFAKLQIIS